MVFRIFVEKKPGLDNEAQALKNDIKELLQIGGLENVRLFNRYDAENLSAELFEANFIFEVEYLPGQFDQRADSAAECIQIISRGERPDVKTAKVYALYGKLSDEDREAIKKYVINAVESREADMDLPETLVSEYEVPDSVETVEGFCRLSEDELAQFIADRGLAMDLASSCASSISKMRTEIRPSRKSR